MNKCYRDLLVWQKSMDLVVECYRLARSFPKHELYGLTSQLQRSAVSVPSNIAEGNERQHDREFLQHLSIAAGSLAELETQLELAMRLGYIEQSELESCFQRSSEIGRMINGLRRTVQTKLKSQSS